MSFLHVLIALMLELSRKGSVVAEVNYRARSNNDALSSLYPSSEGNIISRPLLQQAVACDNVWCLQR